MALYNKQLTYYWYAIMSSNQEPVNKSDEKRRKLQRNKNGNEDPAATSVEDAITKEEKTEYYEEGNGGATDWLFPIFLQILNSFVIYYIVNISLDFYNTSLWYHQ